MSVNIFPLVVFDFGASRMSIIIIAYHYTLPCSPVKVEHNGGTLLDPDTVKTSVKQVPLYEYFFPTIGMPGANNLAIDVVRVEGPVITKVLKSNRIC